MKLVTYNRDFVDAQGHPLMEVVRNCSVNAALVGFQCDAIALNLVDIARLQLMNHEELQHWLSEVQKRIKISFDPGVVK